MRMESPQLNRLEKANDALVGSTATLVRECNSFLHVAAPDYRSSGITPASRHALLVRHDKGLDVYSVLPCSENSDPLVVFNVPGQVLNATWCPNGKFLAVHSANEGICLYRHPTWDTPNESPERIVLTGFTNSSTITSKTLRGIQWSPLGTYLVCFWQYDAAKATAATAAHGVTGSVTDDRNVLVWDISKVPQRLESGWSLSPMTGFTLKGVTLGQWPVLRWRNDERFCCLTSRSEVVVYPGSDVGGAVVFRVPLPGVMLSEPAPLGDDGNPGSLTFAAFAPSINDEQSMFYVVEIPDVSLADRLVKVQQPLGVADTAVIHWSFSGSAVLLLAYATVDAAGENYGGVGDAYLAWADGSLTVKVNQKVAEEVAWNPTKDEFILIEGKSPSDISLYDANANLIFSFPVAYRNTLRWDAFGRMVAVGGFGNLAGDLSFWFRDNEVTEDERRVQLISEWREACTVLCEWSPEGRMFFTASTFPRMKVDNYFKIFTYEGELLVRKEFKTLFDVQWKPLPPSVRPSVPPPPSPQTTPGQQVKKFRAPRLDGRRSTGTAGGLALRRKEVGTAPFAVASSSLKTSTPSLSKRVEKQRQAQECQDWRMRDPIPTTGVAAAECLAGFSPSINGTVNNTPSSTGLDAEVKNLPELPAVVVSMPSNNDAAVSRIKSSVEEERMTSVEGNNASCYVPNLKSNFDPTIIDGATATGSYWESLSSTASDAFQTKAQNALELGADPAHVSGEVGSTGFSTGETERLQETPALLNLLKRILPRDAQIHVEPISSTRLNDDVVRRRDTAAKAPIPARSPAVPVPGAYALNFASLWGNETRNAAPQQSATPLDARYSSSNTTSFYPYPPHVSPEAASKTAGHLGSQAPSTRYRSKELVSGERGFWMQQELGEQDVVRNSRVASNGTALSGLVEEFLDPKFGAQRTQPAVRRQPQQQGPQYWSNAADTRQLLQGQRNAGSVYSSAVLQGLDSSEHLLQALYQAADTQQARRVAVTRQSKDGLSLNVNAPAFSPQSRDLSLNNPHHNNYTQRSHWEDYETNKPAPFPLSSQPFPISTLYPEYPSSAPTHHPSARPDPSPYGATLQTTLLPQSHWQNASVFDRFPAHHGVSVGNGPTEFVARQNGAGPRNAVPLQSDIPGHHYSTDAGARTSFLRSVEHAAGRERPSPNMLNATSLHSTSSNGPQTRSPPFSDPVLNPATDVCWEYIDPQGAVQGPFHISEMQKWIKAKCCPATLPVRYSPVLPFRPLSEVLGFMKQSRPH